MALDGDIDRLYGLPLDEFVAERDALAKRLRGQDREAADRVKNLRKPTAGAWALNQAVRRRRSETDALLEAGERLRAAHAAMLEGAGAPDELRSAMAEERSLATVLADCAEAIASETGKSGPALRERVRSTLRSAALDETARDELAAGRLTREQEAVGLGSLEAPARGDPAASRPRRRAEPRKERGGADERERRRELVAARKRLDATQAALSEAEGAQADAAAEIEAARSRVTEAQQLEREARKRARELKHEVAKQERDLGRLDQQA